MLCAALQKTYQSQYLATFVNHWSSIWNGILAFLVRFAHNLLYLVFIGYFSFYEPRNKLTHRQPFLFRKLPRFRVILTRDVARKNSLIWGELIRHGCTTAGHLNPINPISHFYLHYSSHFHTFFTTNHLLKSACYRCVRELAANHPAAGTRPAQPEKLRFMNLNALNNGIHTLCVESSLLPRRYSGFLKEAAGEIVGRPEPVCLALGERALVFF